MALDNIAALLHTSSRQASDVIEIACEGGGESPGDRALRRQVAAGLRLELASLGRTLTSTEFQQLVQAELVRQKHRLPARREGEHRVVQPSSSPPTPQQLFSAYSLPAPAPDPAPAPAIYTPDWNNFIIALRNCCRLWLMTPINYSC